MYNFQNREKYMPNILHPEALYQYFFVVLIYVSIGTLCQLYAVCQFLELINSSTETISLIICINYKYQKLNIQNRSDMAHDK